MSALTTPGRVMPHSAEAEEYLLSCCLLDGKDTIAKCVGKLPPAAFFIPANRVIYERLVALFGRAGVVAIEVLAEELRDARQLDEIGGLPYLLQVSSRIPTTAQADYFIERVHELHVLRQVIRVSTSAVEQCYAFQGGLDDLVERVRTQMADAVGLAQQNAPSLKDRLETRRFDLAPPPPTPVPRFLINGKPVCTPGNLTNLIAQAKAGKSAVIGALIAAAICAENQRTDLDTLGVTAAEPAGRHLIHIDTEQSPYDQHALVVRALRRADVQQSPPWLVSYALAGFSANELRQALHAIVAEAHARGGVFAVLIDGTADLVNDVNDPAECNAFIAELHDLAITYDCPIVNVVHENPGQDGGRMRGHLGSQLERKAESNLRLKKAEEITVVFSEKMRRAPILEKDGPRFQWSDAEGMHVSTATKAATHDEKKRAELADVMADALEGNRIVYTDLRTRVMEVRGCAAKTAERIISNAVSANVIRKAGMGYYELVPSTLN